MQAGWHYKSVWQKKGHRNVMRQEHGVEIKATDPTLSVIVLFYHGDRWVEPCIRSLEDQSLSKDRYEIIAADNGGSTPSIEKYRGNKGITVIRFPSNHGFAGGNNLTFEQARGRIILLMNQDAVAHYFCLEELLDSYGRHADGGAISANMLMVTSQDAVDCHASISDTVGFYKLSRLGYFSYDTIQTVQDAVQVDIVSGSCMSFRREIVREIGGRLFSDRLGSYTEDLDFSLRLQKTSWKMYVLRKAVVFHYRDDAFSGKPYQMLEKLIHVSVNRLTVYYDNLKLIGFAKKFLPLLMGIPFKVLRPDGKGSLSMVRFMVALGAIPLILLNFGLRVMADIKSEKQQRGTESMGRPRGRDGKGVSQRSRF